MEEVLTALLTNNPQSSDTQFIRQLLQESRQTKPIGARLKQLSARLLGLPYLRNPLIGSPSEAEVLVTRMDGFDCVTFLETLLALARIRYAEDFPTELRKLRYANGEVDYRNRLHYATDWSRHQVQRGVLTVDEIGRITSVVDRRHPERPFLVGVDLAPATVNGEIRSWLDREVAVDDDEIDVTMRHPDSLDINLRHSLSTGWATRLLIVNTGAKPLVVDRLPLVVRSAPGRLVSGIAAGSRMPWGAGSLPIRRSTWWAAFSSSSTVIFGTRAKSAFSTAAGPKTCSWCL